MEALSGEHAEEYYKAMNEEIKSLIIRDTWEAVPIKYMADHQVITETSSFK